MFQRHRAIIWYAFEVTRLNSRGGGRRVLKAILSARLDLNNFFTETFPCHLKLSGSLRLRGAVGEVGLCLAGFDVVAQTQSYYLVWFWGSLVEWQGWWGGFKV